VAEVLLRLRRDATLEPGERPALVEGHVRAGLGAVGPGVTRVLELLAGDGATEDALDDAVGEPELMGLQLLLRRLEAGGWLERTVADEGRSLATLTPIGHAFAPVLAPAREVVLSRFAHVRLDEGALVVETPRAGVRVTLHDDDAAARVFALRAPTDVSDPVVALLARAGIAVAPGSEDGRELAQWSFADLLFHARSRVGRNLGGYGGSFRFEGRFEPLPARRPAFEPALELPVPDLDALAEPSFQQVLDTRSSIRVHDDERPLTVAQLGEFLYRVARVRGVWNDGHEEVVSRPFPAGGSLHELELYPLVENVAGLEPGLYHYDGHAHALGLVAPVGPPTKLLLEYARRTGVMERPPQVAILLAARFGRMMWKYESMPYAAILKHVGVAYQTMYLVATAMGLAPCGLGGGNSDAFAAAAGTSFYDESTVGEFLLGTRPATTSPASTT
jgi:SagB-type dehydrogenase family enzyme